MDRVLLSPVQRPLVPILLLAALIGQIVYAERVVPLLTSQGPLSDPLLMWLPASFDLYGFAVIWVMGGVFSRASRRGIFTDCYLAGMSWKRILLPFLLLALALFLFGGLVGNAVGLVFSYDPFPVRVVMGALALVSVTSGSFFNGAGVVLLNVLHVPASVQVILYYGLTFATMLLLVGISDWVTPFLRDVYLRYPDAWFVSLVHPMSNAAAFVTWGSFYAAVAMLSVLYLVLAPLVWKLAQRRNAVLAA